MKKLTKQINKRAMKIDKLQNKQNEDISKYNREYRKQEIMNAPMLDVNEIDTELYKPRKIEREEEINYWYVFGLVVLVGIVIALAKW